MELINFTCVSCKATFSVEEDKTANLSCSKCINREVISDESIIRTCFICKGIDVYEEGVYIPIKHFCGSKIFSIKKKFLRREIINKKKIKGKFSGVLESVSDKPTKKESIKVSDNKKLGMVQPGSIGDILMVIPIAKYYYDHGFQIIWPVVASYLPMFEYIPFVKAIGLHCNLQDSYKEAMGFFIEERITNKLDVANGFPGNMEYHNWQNTRMPLDVWKYDKAKVPFELKRDLAKCVVRNTDKERELIKELNVNGTKYIAIHGDGIATKLNFNVPNSVTINPLQNYTVFDWLGVLEKAVNVFCVDSSIANLVDGMNIAIGKRFLWYFKSRREVLSVPNYAEDWVKFEVTNR